MDEFTRKKQIKSVHGACMAFYRRGFQDSVLSLIAAIDDSTDKFVTLDELQEMSDKLPTYLDVALESYSKEVEAKITEAFDHSKGESSDEE